VNSRYQRVFIAFSPEENLFNDTVMIGLRYVKNDVISHSEADFEIYTGYQIYMSAADSFLTLDPIKKVEKFDYDGSVYLKLVRKGMEYEGYYSKDGKEWMLINKYERDYKIITDQIILGTCSGHMRGDDFDAYFDFIHYAIPE